MHGIKLVVRHVQLGEDPFLPMPHTVVGWKKDIGGKTYGSYVTINDLVPIDSDEVKDAISVCRDYALQIENTINQSPTKK